VGYKKRDALMNMDFGARRQARIARFKKEEKQKIDGSEERIGFASSERNRSPTLDINHGERTYRNPLDHNDPHNRTGVISNIA